MVQDEQIFYIEDPPEETVVIPVLLIRRATK
jgi:hypothetical protein